MDLDEIQQIFFQECEEALIAIESCFGLCQAGQHDGETINTIFRGVHSIKGGAGAFGHDPLQAFTHEYETLLDQLRTGALPLTPALLDTLLAAFDVLSDHIAAARGEQSVPDDTVVLQRLLAAAEPVPPQAATPVASPVAPPAAPPVTVPAAPQDDFDDIFAMLDDLGTSAPSSEALSAPVPVAPSWSLVYQPGPDALDHGGEPLLLLRELARMGGVVVTADTASIPPLDALRPTRPTLRWTLRLPGDLAEDDIMGVFDFVGSHCIVEIAREADAADMADDAPLPALIPPPPPPPFVPPTPVAATPAPPAAPPVTPPTGSDDAAGRAVAAGQTIRVDLDKLDRLVNLVGELVITQAMLAQRLTVHGIANIDELTNLDHLTRELQESAMSIRAQPMKTVFSRVPRIIRELEGQTGKRVRLEVEGEMTEVDKTVVERIGEPLTHLIRNAVDHGLERPEDRIAAGKPPEGTVRLAAEHRSGRIVISIADDGRGIDRDRVKAKAVERGIIPPDVVMTHDEIDNLIFAPGFSTAETISNISGRGVGLDVVRKNVQSLGGRIGIVSNPGAGSVFSLSLPLTLAVLDGMIVQVGPETFVIPLSHVVESLRPKPQEVCRLGFAPLLDVRGSYVPIQNVGMQLGIESGTADPSQAVLIIVETDLGKAILMVDAIIDQRQVVVKSLEANYQAVPGIAGATILGDGRVALILDVDALASRWRQEGRTVAAPVSAPVPGPAAPRNSPLTTGISAGSQSWSTASPASCSAPPRRSWSIRGWPSGSAPPGGGISATISRW